MPLNHPSDPKQTLPSPTTTSATASGEGGSRDAMAPVTRKLEGKPKKKHRLRKQKKSKKHAKKAVKGAAASPGESSGAGAGGNANNANGIIPPDGQDGEGTDAMRPDDAGAGQETTSKVPIKVATAVKAGAKPPVKADVKAPVKAEVIPNSEAIKRSHSDNLKRATSSVQHTPSECPPVQPQNNDDLPTPVAAGDDEGMDEENENAQGSNGEEVESDEASQAKETEDDLDEDEEKDQPDEPEKDDDGGPQEPKGSPKADDGTTEKAKAKKEKSPAQKLAHARYMRFSRSLKSISTDLLSFDHLTTIIFVI